MNEFRFTGCLTLAALVLAVCQLPFCTGSDAVRVDIDALELGFGDLYPGNSFDVKVKVSNVSYVNPFGIEEVRVSFNFGVMSHRVRLLDGDIDSTISETQHFGWISEHVPLEETSVFEVRMRDDVEYQSNRWYEVYFNVKVSELLPHPRAYAVGETLVEKTFAYKVFGDDYIDYVYTLVSGHNASEIDYAYQLGLPLDEILEQGSVVDMMGFSDEEGYWYAWAGKTPVIDGLKGTNEWSDAYHYRNATTHLYLKNDAENLYLLFEVKDSLDAGDAVLFKFDNNADGGADTWEDALKVSCGDDAFLDLHWHRDAYDDLEEGGSRDGAAAYSHVDGVTVFELSHPLDSGDVYDFSLGSLDLYGLGVTYLDDGETRFNLPDLYGGVVTAQMWRVMVATEPLAPNKLRTSLTLDTAPDNPVANNPTLVSGLLSPSSGGEPVSLSFRINLVPIEAIETVTDENGVFMAAYSFPEPGVWNIKAEFHGGEETYACEAVKTIQVFEGAEEPVTLLNTTLLLDVIPTEENGLQIAGSLLPYAVGETVMVLVNGSYSFVETGAYGRFTLVPELNRAGKYNVTALYLGSNVYMASRKQVWMWVDEIPVEDESLEARVLNIVYGLDEKDIVAIGCITAALGYLVWRRRSFTR